MLPTFFTFTRYESERTPGMVYAPWFLGTGRIQTVIIDVDDDAWGRAHLIADLLTTSGPTGDALTSAGMIGDKLES